jgi:hypothetical protein
MRPGGYLGFMATRTPLRDSGRHQMEPSHRLLQRAEEWAEETGFAAEGEPEEGVPWHAVLLIVMGLALLTAFEIALPSGSRRSSPGTRTERGSYPLRASAPATTSRISCVISAWRARLSERVRLSMSSPAFFDAFRIAVICEARKAAADSSSAR